MKIHENGGTTGYRSDSTCGYCRQKGHNQYHCPKVKSDWAWFKDFKIPLDANGNVSRSGWYGNYPESWGQWYVHCQKTYNTIIEREEAAKNKTPTAPRKSSPRSCGFCGDMGHTRRKCTTMSTFLKDCHKANVNWRRAIYKEFVQTYGISVGAAVIVHHDDRAYWGSPNNEKIHIHNGIITSINWDKMTVFSALDEFHEDVHSPVIIKVLLANGQTVIINNELDKSRCVGKGARPTRYGYGEKYSINKVIAPAKQPLGEDWINGYKGAFDTLTKKRSYEQLKNGMASQYGAPDLVKHIEAWK